VITLALNLILVFALVPRFGAQGAAIASTISYAAIFLLVARHFHTSTQRSFSEVFVRGSLRG
jgi:O-antigen/teichoic acid export membrane protein